VRFFRPRPSWPKFAFPVYGPDDSDLTGSQLPARELSSSRRRGHLLLTCAFRSLVPRTPLQALLKRKDQDRWLPSHLSVARSQFLTLLTSSMKCPCPLLDSLLGTISVGIFPPASEPFQLIAESRLPADQFSRYPTAESPRSLMEEVPTQKGWFLPTVPRSAFLLKDCIVPNLSSPLPTLSSSRCIYGFLSPLPGDD